MDQRLLDYSHLRWITKLIGFDFELQYKAGAANRVADALSHRGADSDSSLSTYFVANFVDNVALRRDQLADPVLGAIIQSIKEGTVVCQGYVLRDDLLLHKGRLVLPQDSVWVVRLLHELHDTSFGGHSRFFRTFKKVLGNVFWHGMKKDVKDYVARCETTPFRVVYGRDPPTLLRLVEETSVVEDVNEKIRQRNAFLDELKEHLALAQHRMKQYAYAHRRELEFQPGNLVLLKLKPYRLRSLARKVNEKLSPRFYGPLEVLARIGKVAYRLKLPKTAKIHHVFHVSQLKRFHGREFQGQPLPPLLSEELELVVTPEAVLQVRREAGQPNIIKEVLVKWVGLPECDATWEPLQSLLAQFPDFNLGDKVLSEEGSNVRPPIKWVYSRRGKKVIGMESSG
ncbi:hypothetical protein LWI29_014068 [Acer saccharum]|uniref:Chromo domain-containing protein n=1 Tax=Acer saccharum TaxID=4024 RepID=A0AA39W995_ACESA|nr:hypothetical protein LWI29_014068 [Acer saccharum]